MYLVAFLFVPTPLLGLQESGMSRTDGETTRADLERPERILLLYYTARVESAGDWNPENFTFLLLDSINGRLMHDQ